MAVKFVCIAGEASADLEEKVNAWIEKQSSGFRRAIKLSDVRLTVEGELLYFSAIYELVY